MSTPQKNKPKHQIVSQTTSVTQTSWSAPIPPPNLLSEYDRICPGSADKIIAMAHNQSAHRMQLEQLAIRSNYKKAFRGQIFGFCIGITGILGAIFMGYLGHDVLAGTIATVSIGSLAVVFVVGKEKQTKSLESKK